MDAAYRPCLTIGEVPHLSRDLASEFFSDDGKVPSPSGLDNRSHEEARNENEVMWKNYEIIIAL